MLHSCDNLLFRIIFETLISRWPKSSPFLRHKFEISNLKVSDVHKTFLGNLYSIQGIFKKLS